MAEEIELKLALPVSARRALLRHPLIRGATKLGTRRLVNVYHDTPDLALHRHAIALRTRRQGRDWIQTVKCAGSGSAGLSVRPEWERPYGGAFDFAGVDDGTVRRLLERRRIRSRLEASFETVFSRTTWRIEPAPGASVLIMLDRGRIRAGDAAEDLSELELELERGSPQRLFDLAAALASELPLRPAILSKAERGIRLRQGARPVPVRAGASPVRPEQSPSQAWRSSAAACIAQLQSNEPGVASEDPEFIHQMRVALRRLRSALRLFEPVLPAAVPAEVTAHMDRLDRALGLARDADVLHSDVLAPVRAAFPEDARIAELCAAAQRDRAEKRAAAAAALAAREHALFILSFGALLHAPAAGETGGTLAEFAARRIGRLHRKVRKLARAARGLDASALHRLRVAAKRLRYAIEFMAPLYRAKDSRRALAALARLQDTLGALNDLDCAGAPLARWAGEDPALREAVALAGGWHGPRYERLRAQLPERIGRVLASKRFWRKSLRETRT